MMFTIYTLGRGIHATIVLGSAALTAIYGWTIGADFGFVFAAICFMIFFALSLLVWFLGETIGQMVRDNRWRMVGIVAPFLIAFTLYDIATNYGAMALFRASEINTSEVANTRATNAKTRVTNLQKRIDDIRAQTAWQTTYLAPEAYDALIESAILARDNESKRGGCGRICEQKTQELAELRANKANAERRIALKAEMDQLMLELKEAKLDVAETPTTVSAAVTHAMNFQSWVTGKMQPDESTLWWSNNGITLAGSVATSLAGLIASFLMGVMAPPLRARYVEPSSAPVSPNPYLSHYGDADEPTQPSRRRREPVQYGQGNTTVILPGGQTTVVRGEFASTDAAIAMARRLLNGEAAA